VVEERKNGDRRCRDEAVYYLCGYIQNPVEKPDYQRRKEPQFELVPGLCFFY
jgi:hypothetical protein